MLPAFPMKFRMNSWIWGTILARNLFYEQLLTRFWCAIYQSYPNVTMLAYRVLFPFASKFHIPLREWIITLLHIKTKTRNRLNVEDEMRLPLANAQPRILKVVAKMQAHPSH